MIWRVFTAKGLVGYARVDGVRGRFSVDCVRQMNCARAAYSVEDRLTFRVVTFEPGKGVDGRENLLIVEGRPSWLRGQAWYRPVSFPKKELRLA